MKFYIASSWRNSYYDSVVRFTRTAGHQVWDWRNPPTGGNGFGWTAAGMPCWKHGDKISADEWRETLAHPVSQAGFASDLAGMNWCDMGVLLHPCGRSAHLEAGWLAGRGKHVHLISPELVEPDLMVLALGGEICASMEELLHKIT
jgi:hypothetical protein